MTARMPALDTGSLAPLRARYLAPLHWREAAVAVPALPLLYLAGLALGSPEGALVAAGAAFSVGFGAAHDLPGHRWGAMLAALAVMLAAAFAGTLAGQYPLAFPPCAALVAAGVAYYGPLDTQKWWVGLQGAIVFLIAGHFHGGIDHALWRSAMVLLGGGVEAALILALVRLFPRTGAAFAGGQGVSDDPALVRPHMLRAAICVLLGLWLVSAIGLANGYWAPMTAMLVLKPRLHQTRTRGAERLGGTLIGCLLASLYAWACHDLPGALLIGLTLSAWCAFALQKAHYATLTIAISASVVLLASLGTDSANLNAWHRVLATLIGGGIALVVSALVPHSLPRVQRKGRGITIAIDRVGG